MNSMTSKRERLIEFLEYESFQLRNLLIKTNIDIKNNKNLDENLKILPKLKAAKTAMVTLLRASKKIILCFLL